MSVEEILRTDAPDISESTVMSLNAAPESGEWATGQQRDDELTIEYLVPHGGNRPPAGQTRRLGVVLAVAAMILVVVGVVVMADGDNGDVVTVPASSSTATDTVPSPSAAEPVVPPSVLDPVSSYRWSRVPYSEAVFGEGFEQVMSSVTVGGPGLVAVGSTVWTSVDGISWSLVPDDEAIFAEAPIHSVTAGGPGLVAVGVAFGDTNDSAAVWTSVDGITWSRVPHDEAVFGGAAMTSVTAGGPGLVAVGWDGHPHGEESNAVVWTSPDGITWSRVPHDEAIFGNVTGLWMTSVTVGGPGLVAVGDAGGAGEWGAAVWTSPDGITWSRAPRDEAVFGARPTPVLEMRRMIAGGPGLVAVGANGVVTPS